ncbi:ABC transporter substrate-binding protein [Mesorhizobium sp. BAC0120]|uniref:ABC transporter substrate-binding protein n=1 Tax=Mesorhizobium sp. BAC0120 TaxID=3090670 RepID=UPI00298C2133|nr:ABC transporter substrate-binding protein [Mesorhizobium sp. BAC0120]MDW6021131.1 ABC transporter substrate-binding protein [Mesorhizobium sp. BAC0120]
MTIACYAAGIQEYVEGDILPAFEKEFNVKVSYLPGVSLATISKLQAQKDNPQIDVACLDDGPREQAKAMGLLQATDPSKMPNLAKVYDVAKMPDNIGIGWAMFGVGIVYNPEAYKKANLEPPKSWNDLARPELKGHVIADTVTSTYGLDLLIMLAKANGGDLDNMDPGFAKMKEVAENVPTFDTTADLSPFFQQADAWAGVWTNGEANGYRTKTGFPMEFVYPAEGAPALFATANVVKNAPNADLADAFLNYLVGKEAQQVVGEKIGFGPVNSEVVLPPEKAANVTYGADAAKSLVQLDWAIINEKRAEWTDRWNREIER